MAPLSDGNHSAERASQSPYFSRCGCGHLVSSPLITLESAPVKSWMANMAKFIVGFILGLMIGLGGADPIMGFLHQIVREWRINP